MTIMSLAVLGGGGELPVWVWALAILCDTTLIAIAMLTGLIHA